MALTLQQSCATCCHFDGDCHCSLPIQFAAIPGFIGKPDSVVCAEWDQKDTDEQGQNLLELVDASDVPQA